MGSYSLTDFLTYLRDTVGIDDTVLPDGNPVIEFAYNLANNTVTDLLAQIPTQVPNQFLYNTAVACYATQMLLTWATDQPNKTFFADLQKKYNLHSLVAGPVKVARDENTATELKLPNFYDTMTLSNIDLLKTPWGRQYLDIVQSLGSMSLLTLV